MCTNRRYSVSLNDGAIAVNGAGSLQFFTPNSLVSTLVYGNTFISGSGSGTLPVIHPFSGGVTDAVITANAIISQGGGPVLAFPSDETSGFNFTGNSYWDTVKGVPVVFQWAGVTYKGLKAFREGSGQEEGQSGTDSDPGLVPDSAFFRGCVEWQAEYPPIPNSPALDAIRGFSGC